MTKKRGAADIIQDKKYNTLSTSSGLPFNEEDYLDKLSGINPTYSSEYSPSTVAPNANASQRVDFGENPFNTRLGKGLNPEQDVNQVYYENQGAPEQLAKGVGRLAGSTILKSAQGISSVGSLAVGGLADAAIGAGNLINSDEKQNADYISINDMLDNPVVKGLTKVEDALKDQLQIYKPGNYEDLNFMQQLGTTSWWADEGADAFAFALSNFIPAGVLGKIGLGAKLATGLGAAVDLAEDTGNLVNIGRGLFGTASRLGDKIGKMGTLGEYANEILLAKSGLSSPVQFAKNVDLLTQNAFMTSSEALSEAQDTGKTIQRNYLQKKYGTETSGFNDEQLDNFVKALPQEEQKQINDQKAEGMKSTFWANVAALSLSNHIEAGLVNKVFGENGGAEIAHLINSGEGIGDAAARIERKGLQRFFMDTKVGTVLRNIPKYSITEGLYEENIQDAIQKISTQNNSTGKLDYIGDVLQQSVDNLSDKQSWKAIGAGMLIGSLMGGVGSLREKSEQNHAVGQAVGAINKARENFLNVKNVLYEKNDDGSIKLDDEGQPVYNTQAITDYAANSNQVKDLQDLHDGFKNINFDQTARLIKDELFTKYALAHLEAGLGDELQAKVKALQSYKDEDLAEMGLDPIEIKDGHKVTSAQRAGDLMEKTKQITNDYNQILKTIPQTDANNARINEAAKAISRVRSLNAILKDLRSQNFGDGQSFSDLIFDGINTGVAASPELIAEKQAHDYNTYRVTVDSFQESLDRAVEKGNITEEQRKVNQALIDDGHFSLDKIKEDFYKTPSNSNYTLDEDGLLVLDSHNPDARNEYDNKRKQAQAKVAKLEQLTEYNRLTNFKTGEDYFNGKIVYKKFTQIQDRNIADDAEQSIQQYNEGDFVEYGEEGNEERGYVIPNENGQLTINGQPLDENFISSHPELRKYTSDELKKHKETTLKNFRKSQIQDRIDRVNRSLSALGITDNQKQEDILNNLIKIEDLVNNKEKGVGRTSERKLSRQIDEIQTAINDLANEREELAQQSDELKSKIEDLKDDMENGSIEDNYEQLDTHQKDLDAIDQAVEENTSLISRLQDALKTFQNLWRRFFPNKALNLEKGKRDYTDAKQEIQLTKEEIEDAEKTNADLLEIKSRIQAKVKFLEDEIKAYELEAAKLEYNPSAKPETTNVDTKTGVINLPTIALSGPMPDIADTGLFKTAGSHLKDGELTGSYSQKAFFKFTEELDPKNPEGYALRTLTINDSTYGKGTQEDLFREEDEQYQTVDNIKVLVVDRNGEPVRKNGTLLYTSLPEITDDKTESSHFSNFRSTDEALAKQQIENYRVAANLIKQSDKPLILQIVGKSNGKIVTGNLITAKEAFGENLPLRIITDDLTTINGKDYPLPKGLIYTTYNGQPIGAQNRTLTPLETKATLNKLKEYAKLRGDKGAINNGSLLNQIKGTVFLGERKTNPELSTYFVKGQDRLVFGDSSVSTQDLIEGKYDTQLEQFLANQNHQVDAGLLNKNEEYKDINDKDWKSYSDYLLSGDEAPLTFKMQPKSDDINKPQFYNTYLTFSAPKETEKIPSVQTEVSQNQASSFDSGTNFEFTSLSSLTTQSIPIIEQIEENTLEEIPTVNTSPIQTNLLDDLFLDKGEVIDYTPANIEAEESWFKKNISDSIPFIKVKGLIDNRAYGKFVSSGEVLISDIATEGTAYHEAFHVVSQLYLTDKERNSLYNKWREENKVPNKINLDYKEDDSPGNFHISLKDENDKEVGFIHIRDVNSLDKKDGKLHVSYITLHPNLRGIGMQEILYQEAINKAKELGYNGIVSGDMLAYPEKTGILHSKFNHIVISKSKYDNSNIVELTGHKDDNFLKNYINNYNSGNADTKNIEEHLAEEFREYMLTKESLYKSWFQKIVDFIKGLLNIGNDNKDILFDRIGSGYFKNAKIVNKSDLNLYKVTNQFDSATTRDLMDSLTLTFVRGMFKNNFSLNDITKFNANILNTEDKNRFANLYESVFATVIKQMQSAAKVQDNGDFINNEIIPYIESNKKSLQEDHIKYLSKFGINLQTDSEVSPPEEHEMVKDTLGIISAIEFSSKSGMPNVIKLMIASLPELSINSEGKKVPVLNNLGLPKLSDYKRNTSILQNELANIGSFREQIYKVQQLSTRIPEFGLLLDQLGVTANTVTPINLRDDYFDLQAKWRQQFDKAFYTFYIQLYDGSNSYLLDSNTDKLTNTIKAKWQGDSFQNKSAYKIVNGNYILNSKYFDKTYGKALKGAEKTESVLNFYKDLGITFSKPGMVNIDLLADKMRALMKKIETTDISSVFDDNAESKGFINEVMSQEILTSFDYSDNQHINPEGKTVYNVSLHNYLTKLASEINDRGLPEELTWDEEIQDGNPLLRNSLWAKKFNDGKKIKVVILDGARIDEPGETGSSTADLTYGDAASQQFTSVLNGINPYLRAGDKSLEHGFTFGENVKYMSLDEATQYYSGALADELLSSYMLNVEGQGSEFVQYANVAKDLRVFKGIFNDNLTKQYQSIITNGDLSRAEAIEQIDNFSNLDEVKAALQKWSDNYVEENKKVLLDNRLIAKDDDGNYSLIGIPSELADKFVGKSTKLSEGQMTSLVEQFTFNQLIGNIEQTKIFTGDLAFYKDFFKRTSGLTGTGKTTWMGQDVNEWLNENRPRTYIDSKGQEKIDKKSDGIVNSIVFKDIKAVSSNKESYVNALVENGLDSKYAEKILKPYGKAYEEGDAQGYVTLPEYREFLIRTGDWTPSHEVIFPKLTRGEQVSKKEMGDFLSGYPVLKPQYFGKQTGEKLFVPTFYKFSVIPLIPSVVKGTELESMMHTMHENGIGMSLFASGNKVGGKIGNDLYNEDGHINLDGENLIRQNIDYTNLKVQLDINPKTKQKVIIGTQVRKLVLANLAGKTITINGKQVDGSRIIASYTKLINKTVELETSKLVDELGLEQKDENTFVLKNPQYLRDLLSNEAFSRQAPDNLLEGIRQVLPTEGEIKQFDVLVNRNKIENILMSLVNNNVIKQKTFGDMRVQGASTGFEAREGLKGRSFEDAEKATWFSKIEGLDGENKGLNFYKADQNGTQPMEVYLPHYFKELIGTNVNINEIEEKLLNIVGYRTPTQGLNSIELIRIKGFLPQEAGNLIVVPSEIVVKAGSDFDIDKLSLFFPNYEMRDGKPSYVEYKGNEESLPAIHNRMQDLMWKIVSSPENFAQLITPNSTTDLETIAGEVRELKPQEKSKTDNGLGNSIGWKKNLDIRSAYLLGKAGVGVTALHNVHHVLSQIVKLKSNPYIKIWLDHHEVNGSIDFSQEREVGADAKNSYNILENLSAFLNGFVDIAKNPFLKDINANTDTAGVYFYLLRAGVPLRQAIMFMNQPIITDYLNEVAANNSMALKATENRVGEEAILERVLKGYEISQKNLDMGIPSVVENYKKQITTAKLESYIKGESDNRIVQRQILLDYLNYKDAAQQLSDLIKATTPDTRGTGATMNAAQENIDNYQKALDNDTFENVDKFMSETFVGSFYNAVKKSVKMYAPMFFTENKLAKQELAFIKETIDLNKSADKEKILNIVKNDLVNFALQTSPSDKQKLMNVAKILYNGDDSVAKDLQKAKNSKKLKDNPIIKALFPLVSSNSTDQISIPKDLDNIKMFSKKVDAVDSNIITEGWKELFETNPKLAKKLVVFSILQSGLNNSPVSFTQFVPNEYYVPLANKLLGNSTNFDGFEDKFYRNNYQNDDLVPKTKKFINTRNGTVTIANGYTATIAAPRVSKITGKPLSRDLRVYPYIKAWNGREGKYELYHNTGEMTPKNDVIFERVSTLGDGYNLKEWSDESMILSNRKPAPNAYTNLNAIGQQTSEIQDLMNDFKDDNNKPIC